jgi:carboxypeptidase Q
MRVSARFLSVLVLFLMSVPSLSAQVAQEAIDMRVVNAIRDEGLNRSQLPELVGYLTDVIGPRLTGSPGMKRANEWTAQKFREWGLQNVVIEPWGEFGRGWENVDFAFRMVTPYTQRIDAAPLAWTGSTDGKVTGEAVIMDASTPEELEQYRGRLRGKVVLQRAPADIPPEFEARERRFKADELFTPVEARPQRTPEQQAERQRRMAEYRRRAETRQEMSEFLVNEGVAAVLQPSRWTYGILLVGGVNQARAAGVPEGPPQLVVAHEDYGQIWRDVKRGVPVTLELNVKNRWYDDDLNAYNTLADLPGTDLADQYVMIGGHLDSWHTSTGATDNAAGTAVMMEAMRILKTLGVKPRRTIRIALWSGEEQGLLGSRGWVQKHPELHDRISAYLNVDNGTGRIRGIWDQSNDAAIPIFEQTLWPFRDLGVVAVRHGNTGGTDHLAFDAAGIPGFNFIQDPIEYSFRTHHSDIDTYERLMLDDLEQAAVVVAATAYHLAMRDDMMPRKATAADGR